MRDPKAITTRFQYDRLGQMTVVTDALTGTTRYAFDAAGQVITITDALTHTTVMAYDLLGRQRRQADALGHTSVYTCDAARYVLTGTAFANVPGLARVTVTHVR